MENQELVDKTAENIKRAHELYSEISEIELTHDADEFSAELREAVVIAGQSTATEMLQERIEQIAPELTSFLIDKVERSKDTDTPAHHKLEELLKTREKLRELEVSTNDINQAISAVEEQIRSEKVEITTEDEIVMNALGVLALSKYFTPEGNLANHEASEDDYEQPIAGTIKISVDTNEAGYPIIKTGGRERKLFNGSFKRKDYSAEKFAAVYVLSNLEHGEDVRASELWSRICAILDIEQEKDEVTMGAVRNFLQGLTYRNQPMFLTGERGNGSSYMLNPELKYDLQFIFDEDLQSTVDNLMEFKTHVASYNQEEQEESADTDETAEEVIDDTVIQFTPKSQVSDSSVVAVDSKAESIEEIDLTEIALPDIIDLKSFMMKLGMTLSDDLKQALTETQSARFNELLDWTKFLHKHINETYGYTEFNFDNASDLVAEKMANILLDPETLNKALDLDRAQWDESLDSETLDQIGVIFEVATELNDKERELLKKIIELKSIDQANNIAQELLAIKYPKPAEDTKPQLSEKEIQFRKKVQASINESIDILRSAGLDIERMPSITTGRFFAVANIRAPQLETLRGTVTGSSKVGELSYTEAIKVMTWYSGDFDKEKIVPVKWKAISKIIDLHLENLHQEASQSETA